MLHARLVTEENEQGNEPPVPAFQIGLQMIQLRETSHRSQGYYIISTVKWPSCYLYLQDQEDYNARGWSGDPGTQGYFKLTKQMNGRYLITTKKWTEIYFYMQGQAGNARGLDDLPGEDCDWEITKVPRQDHLCYYLTNP